MSRKCFFLCKIKPGREFETDRYLISVEESNDQPCPKPSFAVNDPTMKNKPKSSVRIQIIFKKNISFIQSI